MRGLHVPLVRRPPAPELRHGRDPRDGRADPRRAHARRSPRSSRRWSRSSREHFDAGEQLARLPVRDARREQVAGRPPRARRRARRPARRATASPPGSSRGACSTGCASTPQDLGSGDELDGSTTCSSAGNGADRQRVVYEANHDLREVDGARSSAATGTRSDAALRRAGGPSPSAESPRWAHGRARPLRRLQELRLGGQPVHHRVPVLRPRGCASARRSSSAAGARRRAAKPRAPRGARAAATLRPARSAASARGRGAACATIALVAARRWSSSLASIAAAIASRTSARSSARPRRRAGGGCVTTPFVYVSTGYEIVGAWAPSSSSAGCSSAATARRRRCSSSLVGGRGAACTSPSTASDAGFAIGRQRRRARPARRLGGRATCSAAAPRRGRRDGPARRASRSPSLLVLLPRRRRARRSALAGVGGGVVGLLARRSPLAPRLQRPLATRDRARRALGAAGRPAPAVGISPARSGGTAASSPPEVIASQSEPAARLGRRVAPSVVKVVGVGAVAPGAAGDARSSPASSSSTPSIAGTAAASISAARPLAARQLVQVAEQPEAGHVGERVRAGRARLLGGARR